MRRMIFLMVIAVMAMSVPVFGQVARETVERIGGDGARYHAAEDFMVSDWLVFLGQAKYENEQQFDGYALSTAGALGLTIGWNEMPGNVSVLVALNPNEPIRYLGTQYWLDNCKVGGKPYKNRFMPVEVEVVRETRIDTPFVPEIHLEARAQKVLLIDFPEAETGLIPQAVLVVIDWPKGHKFPIPCFPREKGWYGIGLPVLECAGIIGGIWGIHELLAGPAVLKHVPSGSILKGIPPGVISPP